MKIPIWLTVKNIYKTVFSNLLSFVSIPTVFLLSLQFIFLYLYKYALISLTLFFVLFVPLTIFATIVYGPIISSLIQKYLLIRDNQLSYNKIIPKLDRRQYNYVLFTTYIYFYIYLFPQLIPIIFYLICKKILDFSQNINISEAVFGVPIALAVITIFVLSLKKSFGSSMVNGYISANDTKLKFKKLIEVSSTTIMGNKWRIFFIMFIVLFLIGIFNGISKLIYNPQDGTVIFYIANVINIYISLLIYASINVHIYLFFKDQFEINLAKITENSAEIKLDKDEFIENL